MLSNGQYRWSLVGLATLASIAAGVAAAESTTAAINPIYTIPSYAVSSDRSHDGVQIVDSDGASHWIETDDLYYGRPSPSDPSATDSWR